MNKLNFLKVSFQKVILNFLLFTSTLLTFILGNAYYNSANSPDFGKYIRYLNYYFGELDSTKFEQGNLYYYLVTKIIDINSESVNPRYFEEYISYSIQICNFCLYLILMIGLYKFLEAKNFKIDNIIVVLILLNFFPPMLALRLIFKPEILILLLFIWSMYFFEKYLTTENNIWIYCFVIFSALIISTKLTAALMILTFYLLYYSMRFWKFNQKMFLYSLGITIILFSLLTYENYIINDQLFFNHEFQEQYQDRAKLDIIFNLSVNDLIYSPYGNFHNDSMLGIILLETFDDYFQLYWKSDSSLFHRNQIKPHIHFNSYLAIISTIIFYLLSITYARKYKKEKYIFLSPFIGIFSMLFISLFIAFEESTGDMFKNYYYSFFLILSFIFTVATLLKSNPNYKYMYFLFYFLTIFFVFGFPKNQDIDTNLTVKERINFTIHCDFSSNIFGFSSTECEQEYVEICDDIFSTFSKRSVINRKIEEVNLIPFESYELSNENQIISVKNLDECKKYINNGWKFKDNFQVKNRVPYLNIILFIIPAMLTFSLRNKKK